jgi:hypothetical protein
MEVERFKHRQRVNYRDAALFSYTGKYGVLRREVGGRLDGPRHDLVIMACPVPEQWRLRGQGRSG